ncbi:MAG: lytic transglycosylase domain-containing protein [Clostridia bacterium]|nr:lytic transglycosylase domain-containing protein [Clostridia bacterium]
MKRRGCFRPFLIVLLALAVLYFTVGEGKTTIMKKVYPIKYQEYVERYAEEYALDKNLVYSIIKVESNFKEDAVSVAGAKGLMQLMDKTAEDCSNKAEFGYTIPDDLYVPECNIRLGCYYISQLMAIYENMELAVTAYNGGAGNVNKWLNDAELSDGKGGLSQIPYKETREYVKKVFNTFDIYNRLYKTNE